MEPTFSWNRLLQFFTLEVALKKDQTKTPKWQM